MSYYHTTTKPTKAEVIEDLMRQFDTTMQTQPAHNSPVERAAVAANLGAVLGLLEDPPAGGAIWANITGSVTVQEGVVSGGGIGAGASWVKAG